MRFLKTSNQEVSNIKYDEYYNWLSIKSGGAYSGIQLEATNLFLNSNSGEIRFNNRPNVNGSQMALYSDIRWSNLPDQPYIPPQQNVPTITQYQDNHNHGIPDGTQFMDTDGNTRTWVASGGHYHYLTN